MQTSELGLALRPVPDAIVNNFFARKELIYIIFVCLYTHRNTHKDTYSTNYQQLENKHWGMFHGSELGWPKIHAGKQTPPPRRGKTWGE